MNRREDVSLCGRGRFCMLQHIIDYSYVSLLVDFSAAAEQ